MGTVDTDRTTADAEDAARQMADFAERSQRIVSAFYARQAEDGGFQIPDPVIIGKAFIDLAEKMLADPAKLVEAQAALWQSYARLWENTAKRLAGETP